VKPLLNVRVTLNKFAQATAVDVYDKDGNLLGMLPAIGFDINAGLDEGTVSVRLHLAMTDLSVEE
jgi:hypothetical protein